MYTAVVGIVTIRLGQLFYSLLPGIFEKVKVIIHKFSIGILNSWVFNSTQAKYVHYKKQIIMCINLLNGIPIINEVPAKLKWLKGK